MSTKQSDKQPMTFENCIVVEREKSKVSAKSLVRKQNEYEKGKTFIKVPIFRGFILREIKPIEK